MTKEERRTMYTKAYVKKNYEKIYERLGGIPKVKYLI